MIIVISYQSLAASIIWMIKSRKEEKNYNTFFVVRRERREERWMRHISSLLPIIIQYI